MHTSEELERQAIVLVRQYGFILPKPVKEFLTKLAEFLQWEGLKEAL